MTAGNVMRGDGFYRIVYLVLELREDKATCLVLDPGTTYYRVGEVTTWRQSVCFRDMVLG